MENLVCLIKNKKGFQTLELVILLPLLLFIIFSGFSFTLAFYAKVCVVDATREAARTVALSGSSDISEGERIATEKAKSVLGGYGLKGDLIESTKLDIRDNEEGTDNEYVSVEIRYKQPSIFPYLPKLIGSSPWNDYYLIKSTSVFKKESIEDSV